MYKILVIEDEADIRDNLVTLLETEGYKVVEARNGAVGAALALSESPDLVLCDIVMPEMTGYEVVQKVREREKLLPFIFLTAKSDKKDKQLGMRLGADDYLVKPFARVDLLEAISLRLERARLTQEFLAAKEENVRLHLLKQIPDTVGNLLNKGIGCFQLLQDEEDEEEKQRLREDGVQALVELYALWVTVQKKMSEKPSQV